MRIVPFFIEESLSLLRFDRTRQGGVQPWYCAGSNVARREPGTARSWHSYTFESCSISTQREGNLHVGSGWRVLGRPLCRIPASGTVLTRRQVFSQVSFTIWPRQTGSNCGSPVRSLTTFSVQVNSIMHRCTLFSYSTVTMFGVVTGDYFSICSQSHEWLHGPSRYSSFAAGVWYTPKFEVIASNIPEQA